MATHMSSNDELKRLHRERGDCKRTLTLLQKKLPTTSITESLSQTLTNEVYAIQMKFEKIHHQLLDATEDDEEQSLKEEKEADAFLERCLDMKLQLGALVEQSRSHTTGSGQTLDTNDMATVLTNQTDILRKMMEMQRGSPSSGNQSRTKLPHLDLPRFDGQYTDWLNFRDAFESTIHNNEDLKPYQKMQYLKMALKGSAAEDIGNVQICDANYEPTWTRLKENYEKKINLVESFIDQFMAQSKKKVDSFTDLQNAARKYRQIFDSLNAMGDDCMKLDVWLIYLMKLNMSEQFRTKWEEGRDTEKMPDIEDFFSFLKRTTDIMQRANPGSITKSSSKTEDKGFVKSNKGGIKSHHTEVQKDLMCAQCGESHVLYMCDSFKMLSIDDRRKLVNKSLLCFNCLRGKHSSKKCQSQSRCRYCGQAHHSLLHLGSQTGQFGNQPASQHNPKAVQISGQTQVVQNSVQEPQLKLQDSTTVPDTSQVSTKSMVTTHHSSVLQRALLPTALVHIKDVSGEDQVCRILIDGGGECTMVSEECAQRLGLPRRNARIPVTGAGEVTVGYTKGIVQLNISSLHDKVRKIQADAYVMHKVTSLLPPVSLSHKAWSHVDSLMLADPTFKTPGKIDVILGAEYAHEVNLPHILKGKEDEPIAQLTIFGWIVAGKVEGQPQKITSLHTQCNLDETLKRFWETENVPRERKKLYTDEEKHAEEHFSKTHSRDETGRYVVRLAFKDKHDALGDSSSAAMARLYAMERRFARNPQFHTDYKKFMDEYKDLGHMEEVPPEELIKPDAEKYILPHQAVLRPSSETTKLRVVFDASASTRPRNPSLNDILAVGPILQDDLLSILLRFRTYEVAFSADVEKMYRQISVAPEDRDYQRILWRNDNSQQVKTFRLSTVTYGTSSAPYLATKVLQQMANDYSDEFPEASKVILNSFYMDDLLCGASNMEEARKLRQDIQEVLQRGMFSLRKWSSNSSGLLEELPPDMQALSPEEVKGQSKTITALGLRWSPGSDEFSLIIETLSKVTTKREFCAATAKIFDPLGFISPVTVKLKSMFQSLWLTGIGWDDPIPQDLSDEYQKMLFQFGCLKDVSINRCLPSTDGVIELHGFSDASEKAYGSVIYARGQDAHGNIMTSILIAKSRVAPVKCVSIPRLELNGCLLLAELMEKVKAAIPNKDVKMYAWTDFMVALQWIQDTPRKWNTYVANRAALIQEITPPSIWRHVPTSDNPADCVSRGISPEELMAHQLWWHGPQWLLREEENWPANPVKKCITNEEKSSKVKVFVTQEENDTSVIGQLIAKNSNYLTTIREFSYVLRFIHNCFAKENDRLTGFLSVSEQNQALNRIWAHIQQKCFPEEYKCCVSGKSVPKSSKLRKLVPFLDDNGVMRVKGRLQNADVTDEARHPIILPSHHKFVQDLVRFTHEMYLHTGATHTQCILRAKYWIIGMRSLVKGIVRKCVRCARIRPKLETPFMGDLPAVRVQQNRPFYNTGCDFAGPFQFRSSYLRKSVITKGYLCIFICMVTKSVHLEAVTDLSTEKFIASLRRFTARRGQCGTLYCDNATNFVGATGASRDERIRGIRDHNHKVVKFMSSLGTQFHYIPAYSPTFGGLWERGVGSVKSHIKKVIGDTPLTYEEFSTVLAQIEACINSRPLCAMSSEVDDLQPLTPAHFLVGHPLTLPPGPELMDMNPNRLSRWNLLQRFVQHFWRRWHQEYITTLQNRPKWCTSTKNLEIGDLVLVREPNMRLSSWKMARIIATHPGRDNVVRVVTIKTQEGMQKRAVNTLAKLPVDSSVEDSLNPGNM
ncbi:uncharacterized protein LOC129806797 [Phlebotomus papatasi]|nr:uncharacterized protein LOC129806797 [Phlebotomus papatasi]